jgi:cytochrome c-type biogenesis protein
VKRVSGSAARASCLAAATLVLALLFLPPLASAQSGPASGALAPDFALTDIHGQPFVLSQFRGTAVVVIEFTSLSCAACQIVEKTLAALYSGYNATGRSNVRVISIFVEPQFGDTIPALRAYETKNNITWTMAQDTPSLAVYTAYHVPDIPDIFVIDKQGHAVYDQTGVVSEASLSAAVSASLAGTAAPIALVTVSVFALAAIAGVSTFFSPCAFPMFPTYMGLFLGLDAKRAGGAPAPSGPTYGRAARRAVLAGSTTALGMIVVFLAVGVALIVAAHEVSGYLPDLLVVVGAVLIGLGLLLFTNLQYWRVVAPFQRLWRRLRGAGDAPPAVTPGAADGRGFYLKLFGYGMGYAAAAAGCVAPVIFAAIIAGLALGLVAGLLSVLIYALTAAVLMIVVTVLLGMASRRFINQLKAATPIIKKVSAGALVVVGAYLVYFYYTAWIA